jgi:DNA-binding beta-propeller fold protein YncE
VETTAPDATRQPLTQRSYAGKRSGAVRRIATINLPGPPGFHAAALTQGKLVMAHFSNDSVDVFDIRRRRVVAEVKEMRGASDVAVDEAGGVAYVANLAAKEIAVLSTGDWSVQRRFELGASPRSLLLAPRSGRLYSANWHDRSVSYVEPAQGTIHTAPVEGSPQYMSWDEERGRLYVSLQDARQVAVLDGDLKTVGKFPVKGSQPTGIAFDRNHRLLYVAVRGGMVTLDAETGQELQRQAAPAGVDRLTLFGDRLYAAAGGGKVNIYRTGSQGLALEQEIVSEVRAYTLAYDPQQHLLLLPGGRDGHSQLVLLRPMPGADTTTASTAP